MTFKKNTLNTSSHDVEISASKKSAKPFFQAKLNINDPNDRYEREADAVADQVMRMQAPFIQRKPREDLFFQPPFSSISPIQRKCDHCEVVDREMQRKEINGLEPTIGSGFENYVASLGPSGHSLPTEVKSFFEPRLGHDFSEVKVHTDSLAAKSAQSINALAYTSGNDIVFNTSQYSPQSESGKRLLGHELVHVVQQKGDVSAKTIQRQPDFLRGLDPSCQVDWQPVWEGRFELGRDVSCGAQTPLGRINTSDIYAAYQYVFGDRPPGRPSGGTPCPRDRTTLMGGCCPENAHYDSTHLRCVDDVIDTSILQCPPNWTRTQVTGICVPPIVVPSMDLTLPELTFPRLPGRPRSFGTISSMTVDHFQFDGSAVPPGHESEFDHLVPLLNIYSEVDVHIDGYADSRGEPGYNTGLSQRRADAVKVELTSRGIDSGRIITTPFGETNLLVTRETSEEDRARNRRVDIWYIVQPTNDPLGL